jgi:hypothetical protein
VLLLRGEVGDEVADEVLLLRGEVEDKVADEVGEAVAGGKSRRRGHRWEEGDRGRGDLAAGVEEGALLRGGVAAAGGRWRHSGEGWQREADRGMAASLREGRDGGVAQGRWDLVERGKKGEISLSPLTP